MGEVEDAALAEHDIVVQVAAEAFPELEGVFVEMIVAVEQVVGAHDGGVAADVVAADPALLQQRHVGDAVIARQDRKRVVEGKSVSVRVNLGGGRSHKKQTIHTKQMCNKYI